MTQNSISRKKIIECKLTWFECYYLVILPQDLQLSQFEFPLKQLHLNLYSCIFDFHSTSFFWSFVPMIHQCQNGLILDYYCCYYWITQWAKNQFDGKNFLGKIFGFQFHSKLSYTHITYFNLMEKSYKADFQFNEFCFLYKFYPKY